jgi:hypothetical protein
MSLMRDINRAGFRPWYETQLAAGFGFVALGLILIVAGAAFLEVWLGHANVLNDLIYAGSSFLCLGSGGYCWIKAAERIGAAEHLAQQATCKACKAYGRLELVSEEHLPQVCQMKASCRRCRHLWQLEI